MRDYQTRTYLSAVEAAKYLDIPVSTLHTLVKQGEIACKIAASGQQRFTLDDLKKYYSAKRQRKIEQLVPKEYHIEIGNTLQRICVKNSMYMSELGDNSVNLMVTSPPYFNTKMYSKRPIENDLGNIHDLDEWFEKISIVWREVFRVLQPGRKAFINIMNLPVREEGSFRSLNLSGRTIDALEKIGFVFKRDIVWHKTNAVRAHFGTYPYPGAILINNMHEFILEFEKPAPKGYGSKKYGHLTKEQKEKSKLDKDFWLSIKNSDVWIMHPEKSGDGRGHAAPFPVELPYRLIKAFSYVSETVLDPFVGWGTTLVAAARLERNGIGYEIVPDIAADAAERLSKVQLHLRGL